MSPSLIGIIGLADDLDNTLFLKIENQVVLGQKSEIKI